MKMMKSKKINAEKVIAAIANDWLWLPIWEVLYRHDYLRVKDIPALYQAVEQNPGCVLVIDLFGFGLDCRHIVEQLRLRSARLPIIVLASDNEMPFCAYLESLTDCYLIAHDMAATTLLDVLQRAIEHSRSKEAALSPDLTVTPAEVIDFPKQYEGEEKGLKKEEGILHHEFTRRSFLKGAAATAAAAGVVVSGGGNLLSPLAEAAGEAAGNDEQITYGVCRGGCLGGCPMNVHVRNGRVVKTSKLDHPISEYERICQRGLTHAQRIYQPDRVTHPMRRVGPRGSGEWEQITWDEAIGEICAKWKQYQENYGDDSIAYSYNAANLSAESRNYYRKVFNLMGSTNIPNAFDFAFLRAFPNSVGWSPWTLGDDERNMLSSKYIFAWGSNITEGGNTHYSFIQAAMDRGAKLIVIDPNYIIGAQKADMYVPIRPGTDAVLAMAMLNIAVEEACIDEDTLMYGTVAPFLVKNSDGRFLRLSDLGQVEADSEEDKIIVRAADGTVGLPADIEKPVISGSFKIQGHDVTTAYDLLLERVAEWTPERASEICDIPLDTIYELARMYAEGPTTLAAGYGPDHYGNGHCFYYAVSALAMVTGQLGKPGAGFNGHGFCFYSTDYTSYNHILNPPGANPGPEIHAPKVPEAVNTGKYGDRDVNLKSLFIYQQNILANQTGRKDWLEVFDKMDLVVIADVTMNDTTMYSDIILPVAHYFEVETYMMSYTGVAVYNAKAVEPPGEALGDFEIATLLGKGMGYEDLFTMTREEFLTEALDNDKAKTVGLDWKSIKEAGYIYTITDDTPIYMHGGNFTYPTATGRGQFYREDAAPNTNYGQEFDREREVLPYWEPPIEAWPDKAGSFDSNPLSNQYPLIFTSERPKFKVHTSFSHNPWLLELQPEPTVTFNPQDADARGIKAGDIVRVYNDRGFVVIKAAINPANRPGIVVIDHGWQADEFIEGHYTDLSSCATSDVIINNAYFDCLVEAVKV